MSYDVNKYWFYKIKGRKLRLYKYSQSLGTVDNLGRVSGGDNTGDLIYPDETITNGLRVEYRRLHEPFVTADPVTTNSLTVDSSPSESSHVNLNRMKSLAIVDYLKAMKHEMVGDIELKEYYMKEFWTKLSNDQSNKKNVTMTFPSGSYALR